MVNWMVDEMAVTTVEKMAAMMVVLLADLLAEKLVV